MVSATPLSILAQTAAPLETPDIEWSLLWPLILLSVGGVVLITITSLLPAARYKGFPALFTAAIAIGSFAFLPWMSHQVADSPNRQFLVVDAAIAVDGFTIFVTGVICVALLLVTLILDDYLRREGLDGPEWYVLLMLSSAGGVLLASAEDLIVAFLGLEILSIAVYVLAALHLRRSQSQESGFKYFVLGALSSAIFLYGIAMTYGATGSTSLTGIAEAISSTNANGLSPLRDSSLILVAMAFLLVGFGFKVSAAPFHIWTPDVYEGAPTPVVAFMASVVKVAGFAGLLRVFVNGFSSLDGFATLGDDWRPLLAAMAVLTLLVGAFLAIVQTNIKRMMAYSSITHAGFMLVAVHATGSSSETTAFRGAEAVLFYMASYAIMIVGTFAVITVMGGRGDGNHDITGYRGLARRQPLLAGGLAILLFAQSGVPFTSGFFAKFRVIAAAAEGQEYFLAAIAMLAAVVGAFLYLRVIVAMFLDGDDSDSESVDPESVDSEEPAVEEHHDEVRAPLAVLLVVAASVAATVVLGIWPDVIGEALSDGALTLTLLRP